MSKLIKRVVTFLRDEEGLTTVEYAIGGSLVALAVVGAFTTLGENVGTRINQMADIVLNGASSSSS